ncbi:methyltransferase domain protein [Brucella lupini]|uniref:Methyltransferase domain protein n=1 Tax=Brucella lupini TaxID=255457 RepID=A0A256H0F0_9HYPH|nr:methyltransferase domain protein [Brucella lupini]
MHDHNSGALSWTELTVPACLCKPRCGKNFEDIRLERLPFSDDHAYSAIESSIHVARYSSVAGICENKTVLDLACGEGYGSYLMAKHWHAKKVVGVDISEEAIDKAKENFHGTNIKFINSSAEKITEVLGRQKFDLIVSFETIEHINDPIFFIERIKSLASPDATFVISCPNDHYYYPSENMGNPYHFKKYTAQEFFGLVTDILGEPRATFLGVPIAGFANIRSDNPLLKPGINALDLRRLRTTVGLHHLLPDERELSTENCSYFLGVWGGNQIIDELSATFHAPPMPPVTPVNIEIEKNTLEEGILTPELYKARQLCYDLKAKIRSEQLAKKAANIELKLLQVNSDSQKLRIINLSNEIQNLKYQLIENNARLDSIPWRAVAIYTRIRRFVPTKIMMLMAKTFDWAKRIYRGKS